MADVLFDLHVGDWLVDMLKALTPVQERLGLVADQGCGLTQENGKLKLTVEWSLPLSKDS